MSGENKVCWTVKDLIPNGEYYFRVQAVNKIGGGEFIELRNPVIAEDQKRKKKNDKTQKIIFRSLLKGHSPILHMTISFLFYIVLCGSGGKNIVR